MAFASSLENKLFQKDNSFITLFFLTKNIQLDDLYGNKKNVNYQYEF